MGSATEALKLRATVASYTVIMKVEGFTDQGFSTVPPLEPSLTVVFEVRAVRYVGRRFVPPSSGDQPTTKVKKDKIHQCLSQVGTMNNSTAMLVLSISRGAKDPTPSLADMDQICTMADTITNLCAALVVCSVRISSWASLLQRQMSLKLAPSIPEDVKWELLKVPVSPDGLF